jgi:hypothetical protein
MTVGGIAGRVIEANDEWIRIEVASGVQLDVLRQAVSRRLDGDPGNPSGPWGDRWSADDGSDDTNADDAEVDGPDAHEADAHDGTVYGQDANGAAADGPQADGQATGHDETSETRAE